MISTSLKQRIISKQLNIETISEEEVRNLKRFRFEAIREIVREWINVARDAGAEYYRVEQEIRKIDRYLRFPNQENV